MTKKMKTMITEFKEAIKDWNDPKADKEMKKVYMADRKDLRQIVSLMMSGKIKEASEKAYWLDTIVRDVIPNSAYDYITNEKNHIK